MDGNFYAEEAHPKRIKSPAMFPKETSSEESQEPSLIERLVMAVVAPVSFNISILIILAVFFRRSRRLGQFFFSQIHWSGALVFIVTIVLPAIAGFMMGGTRFAALLGHLFYSNMEHEKDLVKTTAVWGGLFLTAYLLSRVL